MADDGAAPGPRRGLKAFCGSSAASLIAAIAAMMLAPGGANAGAWPQEQGRALSIFTYTFDAADARLNNDGEEVDGFRFRKHELSAYVEYGLTRRISLVGKPVIQRISSEQPGLARETATGFGGSELGARLFLGRSGPFVASVQASALIPGVGENAPDAPLGEGGFGGEARLLLGADWGWRKRGGFAELQVAYRDRAESLSSEARVDATLGLRVSQDWLWLAQSFSFWSTQAAPPSQDVQPVIGADDGSQFFHSHRVQLSGVRRLNPSWSVQAGGFATVSGRNVIDERAGFVSLWRRY